MRKNDSTNFRISLNVLSGSFSPNCENYFNYSVNLFGIHTVHVPCEIVYTNNAHSLELAFDTFMFKLKLLTTKGSYAVADLHTRLMKW
jgi:hypothetical protein